MKPKYTREDYIKAGVANQYYGVLAGYRYGPSPTEIDSRFDANSDLTESLYQEAFDLSESVHAIPDLETMIFISVQLAAEKAGLTK